MICYTCHGAGRIDDGYEDCQTCGGRGNDPSTTDVKPCPSCYHSGKSGITKYIQCWHCHGSGQLEDPPKKNVAANTPPQSKKRTSKRDSQQSSEPVTPQPAKAKSKENNEVAEAFWGLVVGGGGTFALYKNAPLLDWWLYVIAFIFLAGLGANHHKVLTFIAKLAISFAVVVYLIAIFGGGIE